MKYYNDPMISNFNQLFSTIFLIKADSLLEKHFANETEINMDLIYTVIDNYRHAIVLTREVEVC